MTIIEKCDKISKIIIYKEESGFFYAKTGENGWFTTVTKLAEKMVGRENVKTVVDTKM